MGLVSSGAGRYNRRAVVLGGGSALALGVLASGAAGAFAQESTPTTDEPSDGEKSEREALRETLEQYDFRWTATSPATHQGDEYTLTAQNLGSAPVKLFVLAIVMDHRHHHNENAVREEVELAAGEERVFTATNAYGTANHFSTRLFTDAADGSTLALSVTLTDETGAETCRFNERAFMVVSRDELTAERDQRRAERRERFKDRRKGRGDHDGLHGGESDEAADDEATPTS